MTAATVDAIDLNVVHELKMSAPDMGWMAKALLAAAARDEVYGVRCHAHLTADGLTATAAASDGYRIHQLHLPLRSPVDAVEITVPRDALVWAAKNVRTFTPKKDSLIEPSCETGRMADHGDGSAHDCADHDRWPCSAVNAACTVRENSRAER